MSELNMFDYHINGIVNSSITVELHIQANFVLIFTYFGVNTWRYYSLIAIMLTFLSQKSLLPWKIHYGQIHYNLR